MRRARSTRVPTEDEARRFVEENTEIRAESDARMRWIEQDAGRALRDSARIKRSHPEPPEPVEAAPPRLRPGEAEIDSGLVAAWAFAVGAVAGIVSVGWAVRWWIGAGSGEP